MIYTLNQNRKNLSSGFSLIEIMIAIAIMAIMAGLVGPAVFRYLGQSKIRSTEANIRTLKQAVNSYYSFVGKYPKSLEDLVEKPEGISENKWGGPYIEGGVLPQDGWGEDFDYELINPKKGEYKITSANLEADDE